MTRARAPGLDLARSLGVAEGGSGTTRWRWPRGLRAVTVAVAKVAGGSANVSVAPPSLTFAVSDWDGAQTVTVSAADDDDTDPDAATVRHTASGGGYGAVTADLAVSVAENDAPGLVVDADPATSTVIDPGPLALSEGDADAASKGYTVRLATRPAVTVTVTVASADAAAVAVDTDGDTPGDQGRPRVRREHLGQRPDGDRAGAGRRRRGGGVGGPVAHRRRGRLHGGGRDPDGHGGRRRRAGRPGEPGW